MQLHWAWAFAHTQTHTCTFHTRYKPQHHSPSLFWVRGGSQWILLIFFHKSWLNRAWNTVDTQYMSCARSLNTYIHCTTRKLSVVITHASLQAARHFPTLLTHGVWWHTPTLSHSHKHRSKRSQTQLLILQHSTVSDLLISVLPALLASSSAAFLSPHSNLLHSLCCFCASVGRRDHFFTARGLFLWSSAIIGPQACCGTVRPHLGEETRPWRSPSLLTLWELYNPQAFVCLPCSIYTPYVCVFVRWRSASRRTNEGQGGPQMLAALKTVDLEAEFNATTCREPFS